MASLIDDTSFSIPSSRVSRALSSDLNPFSIFLDKKNKNTANTPKTPPKRNPALIFPKRMSMNNITVPKTPADKAAHLINFK